jgi:ABC-type nitrate/sulfonate/bicarbonate transport system substrate-binding protein
MKRARYNAHLVADKSVMGAVEAEFNVLCCLCRARDEAHSGLLKSHGRIAMKPAWRALWSSLALTLPWAVTGTARAADLVPFKIGQSSPANTFLAIWMADAAGLYEANGLKVEIVPMTGGRGIESAFSTGRIDAMHIGLSSVVRANAAGADLRAFGSLSNHIRFALFVAPGIKAAADLRGGVVGISSLGSESDTTLALTLAKIGLKRSDVTIKELGIKRIEGLRAGTIVATAVNEPDRSLAYASGLTALVDLAGQNIPWLFTGLVTKRQSLTDKRDLIARFMKATIEGNRLSLTDAVRAKAVLQKATGVSDPKIIDISYADFRAQSPVNAEILPEAATAIIEAVAPEKASRKLEDYIDMSISQELKAQGFYDAMSAKYPGR